MDMVFFVIELFDSNFGIVLRHLVGLVLEVGAKSLIDDVSSVFGTDDNVKVATVYAVGVMYVFHVSMVTHGGAEEAASASIPGLTPGVLCARINIWI
jgi:hypothetical protein